MLQCGIPRQRIMVVPNGVPDIEPIDAESRLEKTHWRLGLVALMRPRKGVEVALQAIQLLKSQGVSVTLELIGGFESESYRTSIVEMIRRLDIDDRVQCQGFTNDVPSAIRKLDVLVLPSLFGEGMPMVVLEALSAAVPVIATSVEGTPEVIRNEIEGYLAPPNDTPSLVTRILDMTASRQAWMAMSRRALARHREHFSDTRMAQRVAERYAHMLQPVSR